MIKGIIIPTILEQEPDKLLAKLDQVKQMGGRAQIDIMDGVLTERETVGLEELVDLDSGVQLDIHLMVKEPTNWLNRSLATLPNMIIAQVEGSSDIWEFINQGTEAAVALGLAIDILTPIVSLSPDLLHMVDLVLLLAAPMGEAGQPFNSTVLEKIKAVRKTVGDLVDVGVDCGLDDKTIVEAQLAGANMFCVNSTIWGSSDPVAEYQRLTKLVENR